MKPTEALTAGVILQPVQILPGFLPFGVKSQPAMPLCPPPFSRRTTAAFFRSFAPPGSRFARDVCRKTGPRSWPQESQCTRTKPCSGTEAAARRRRRSDDIEQVANDPLQYGGTRPHVGGKASRRDQQNHRWVTALTLCPTNGIEIWRRDSRCGQAPAAPAEVWYEPLAGRQLRES
jgi:hypothetical protein